MLKSVFQSLIRGGQTNKNDAIMMVQVIRNAIIVCIGVIIILTGYKSDKQIPRYAYGQIVQMYKAKLKTGFTLLGKPSKKTMIYKTPSGKYKKVYAHWLANNKRISNMQYRIVEIVQGSFYSSLTIAMYIMIAVFVMWILIGYSHIRKRTIKGRKIANKFLLKLRLMITGKASNLRLDGFPIVKDSETKNILCTGTVGSGKTTCMYKFMNQIINRQDKAIIFDITGGFVEKFYCEGKDYIINPFDKRTVPYSIWKECQDEIDFNAFAKAFVPKNSKFNDRFWSDAGSIVLSTALQLFKNDGLHTSKSSLTDLYDLLVRSDINYLSSFFKGTDAATFTDKEAEKMTISIRATLQTMLLPLKYLSNDYENAFTIREWMRNDNDRGNLFITAPTEKQARTLLPLLSVFFSIGMQELMSLPEKLDRRVWFVIDELPAFNRIPDFEKSLAQLRKYGGCVLAAAQDLGQLTSNYGHDTYRSIMANFNTNLVFANNDNTSANDLSKILGSAKTSETKENRSYSPHSFRDGKQLNEDIRTTTIVSPTEIMMLDTFEYYLKLQGSYPITKHKAKLQKYPKLSDSCEENRDIAIRTRSYDNEVFTLGEKQGQQNVTDKHLDSSNTSDDKDKKLLKSFRKYKD